MAEIPPVYWMIMIGLVIIMICFVLFELGMFIRDSRKSLKHIDLIAADAQQIVSTVKGTVDEVNTAIIKPIRGIGAGVSAVSGFVSGLKGEKEEEKTE